MIPRIVPALLMAALPAGAEPAGRVVIVSIDGLQPSHYLGGAAARAPVLQKLASEGARVGGLETVFPGATVPAHASLVTGVRPARHGIAFDFVWDPRFQRTGPYSHGSDIRARALWQAVRERGGTTAALFWPATADAPIDWLLPAVESMPAPPAALRRYATKGLLDALAATAGDATPETLDSPSRRDAYAAKAASAILLERKPHLLLVRLGQLGAAMREHGRSHEAVSAAAAWVDEALGVVVQGIADAGLAAETTVVVAGSHGFVDYDKLCAPNAVLRAAGLIAGDRPSSAWLVVAHTCGAAAAVFVDAASPMSAAEVEQAFRKEAMFQGSPVYRILSREELDGLGAMPGAAFGLEAEPGWSFTDDLRAKTPFLLRVGRTKGAYGHRPTRPGMDAGLLLRGRGVKAGGILAQARLVDVAPTVARLMGLSMPGTEGRVLAELLAE